MGLRQERIADEIRDIVARCFQAGVMGDPRLEGVTVTGVKISPDLQLASIYFRIYGDDNEENIAQAKKGLESATGFFKKRLAKGLDLRRVPDLRFFYDESIERASKIEDMLRNL